LAPDTIDPDRQTFGVDILDPLEATTYEQRPALPARNLFQIVCLQGAPAAATASTTPL
jgi:hypothetical protein